MVDGHLDRSTIQLVHDTIMDIHFIFCWPTVYVSLLSVCSVNFVLFFSQVVQFSCFFFLHLDQPVTSMFGDWAMKLADDCQQMYTHNTRVPTVPIVFRLMII